MRPLTSWVFEAAHQMALLPVLWLIIVRMRSAAWWWLASVFTVSWMADSAGHWIAPWVVSIGYPITQAGLVSAVFLKRREAAFITGLLVLIGLGAVMLEGVHGPDLLLRTAAWGFIAGLVYVQPGPTLLRWSLLISFGGGLLAWYAYAAWPGWSSWGVYQSVRLIGLLVFCGAVTQPQPRLRLA